VRVTPLLILFAACEGGTGLLLLVWPSIVLVLIFGWHGATAETLVMARVAGSGIGGLAVASWVASRVTRAGTPGVVAGLLTYNVLAAAVLVLAGAGLGMVGIALWPAVVYHLALAVWCGAARKAAGR